MPPKETQTQLTKRPPPTDQQLMPPPPKKRIKRPATVLDEDVYTSALSEIIARDFFPGLLEGQDAETGFGPGIATGTGPGTRVKNARTPTETPAGWGGDTPMSTTSNSTTTTNTNKTAATDKTIPDISNMNLLSFQASYTSEDNESFNSLLDHQNAKRRDKYTWLWSGNQIPSARRIAHQQQERKLLTERGSAVTDSDGGGGGEKALVKTDLDKRPAKPDTWDAKAENSLMFMPDSVEDSHQTIAQRADLDSRMGPRRVIYRNTRLPPESTSGSGPASVPASPSLSAIQDAIAGRPRLSASEAGSAVYTGGETPRVNGYAFVDDEPDPQSSHPASRISSAASSPSPSNPFSISQIRKREDLHHRMVDRMSRAKRVERANVETKTPVTFSPGFGRTSVLSSADGDGAGAGNAKALTPAAQKLLRRVGSTPRSGGSGMGSGSESASANGRNMWTPTPTPKRR